MYMWVYMYIWIYVCVCVCVCVCTRKCIYLKLWKYTHKTTACDDLQQRVGRIDIPFFGLLWWSSGWDPPKLPISIHMYTCIHINFLGFPDGSVVKNPPANAEDLGDAGSVPDSGRSSGEGNGYPLQYSCLGNPMDKGAWQGSQRGPWGHKNSDTT